jgi:hypothetical protein
MNNQIESGIEKAALSMLSDAEIMQSLNISEETLHAHYHIVEKARVDLKQKLNIKRIQASVEGRGPIAGVIADIPVNNKNQQNRVKRKTNNPNGRPKGSTNKISGATILASIEHITGEKFEDLLAQGYYTALCDDDKPTRMQYEKMFLSKVVADKAALDVTSNGETLQTVFNFVHRQNDSFNE